MDAAPTLEPKEKAKKPTIGPNDIQRPPGVPETHHLAWIDPELLRDMHQFYSSDEKTRDKTRDDVIPHHFAPMHARLAATTTENKDELPRLDEA